MDFFRDVYTENDGRGKRILWRDLGYPLCLLSLSAGPLCVVIDRGSGRDFINNVSRVYYIGAAPSCALSRARGVAKRVFAGKVDA